MTGFGIEFLGCKISQTDAESVREALVDAGHSPDALGPIQVVNTCCITSEAEKKSRKRVRQLARTSPETKVFVTGCGANLDPESYKDVGGKVTVLTGGASFAIPAILEAADDLAGLGCRDGAVPRSGAVERTRAFVKIQDGCNFDCSYCIVPTVRGEPRSRTTSAIIADVQKRVSRGQSEIVLTGVNIGLFRDPDSRIGLPALLGELAALPGVKRLRISSIESNHVSPRLAEAMATYEVICNHLHVPMQSGDDGVLRAMGRHYNAAGFARSIGRARDILGPDLNVTTDVILGFPGEDDDAFQRTMDLCEATGITKVHAFPFSARPGTEAFALHADQAVAPEVVKERSRLLRAAADDRARVRRYAMIGQSVRVLAESGKGHGALLTTDPASSPQGFSQSSGPLRGYTENYFPVRLLREAINGELVDCVVAGTGPDGRLIAV